MPRRETETARSLVFLFLEKCESRKTQWTVLEERRTTWTRWRKERARDNGAYLKDGVINVLNLKIGCAAGSITPEKFENV